MGDQHFPVIKVKVGRALNLEGMTIEQEDRWQYEVWSGGRASIQFWEAWRWWRGHHTTLIVPTQPEKEFVFPKEFLHEYQKRINAGYKKRGGMWYDLFRVFIPGQDPPPPAEPPYPKTGTTEAMYLAPRTSSAPQLSAAPNQPLTEKVVQNVVIPPEATEWVTGVFPFYVMEKYGRQPDPWAAWEKDPNKLTLHKHLLKDAKAAFDAVKKLLNA